MRFQKAEGVGKFDPNFVKSLFNVISATVKPNGLKTTTLEAGHLA